MKTISIVCLVYLMNINIHPNCEKTIIDNSFSINPLGVKNLRTFNSLNLPKIINKPFKMVYKNPSANIYDTTVIKKMCVINLGKTNLSFTLDKDNVLTFLSGDILDPKILLYKKIHIGMSKKDFWASFKQPVSNCNTVKIDTDEQSCNHLFTFKNGVLIKIHLDTVYSTI